MPRSLLRRELVPALLFAVIPLLVLVAITALQLFRNVPESNAERIETEGTFVTLRLVSAINRAVVDAERGQRGFLITGRDEYLKPYEEGRARLPGLMAEFQASVQGRPDDSRRVLSLQGKVTTKLNELATTIDAMRANGFDAARRIVETDVGQTSMIALEEDLRVVRDAARDRLQAQFERQEALQRRLTLTFLAGTALAGLALVVGAVLMGRAYIRAARSQGMLQATLDSVREGVLGVDRDGAVQAANAGLERALGRGASALGQGRPLPPMPFGPRAAESLASTLADLQAEAARTGKPVLVERSDSRGRRLEIFHGPAFDGGSVTTFIDVTEQRTDAEVLRQAQKLEALGQMTGGLAHDFNNLLTVVMGSLSLLRRQLAGDPKGLKRIDTLSAAAERGARLTKQLLAFARRQPLSPETVNIGHLMTEVLPLVRGAVGPDVEVECVTAGGLWNAALDAAQFQSAAINLAVNARDAMPAGGRLTIEVANASLDELYAARHPEVRPGQYVAFAITDTGSGMDAATVSRAFDPFFTTKPEGSGTGLGLPQVYGFVKQSGGHVKIYSEVGEGTTVRLYFPRSAEPVTTRRFERGPVIRSGHETILVVDDDEIVRTTVSAMLEDLGYTVIAAASGAEGIAKVEENPAVDLLFTDVIMPGEIGGRQLAERARALRPSLRVLFTSGYTRNAIVHNGRLDAGVELLSKPYDRDHLALRVRRLLDQPVAG